MGVEACCGSKPSYRPPSKQLDASSKLTKQQQSTLKLIFLDLSSRITDKSVNIQNFLLFFHKNGFWGQRLFKEFDADQSNLIHQHEFIRKIAQLFKSTEQQKIQLLFRFFQGSNSEDGIQFNEFLKMLYNYPKEDLKIILNDEDFLKSIKPNLRTDNGHLLASVSKSHILKHLPKKLDVELQDSFTKGPNVQLQPTLIGKQILKNLKNNHKPQTTVEMNMGDTILNVKAMNIQYIVKKYAQKIFKQQNIDQKTGKLTKTQFEKWLMKHNKLYNNYYSGFHNQIWQDHLLTGKPKYLTCKPDMKNQARYFHIKLFKVLLILLHSTIIISELNTPEVPMDIICLEGLMVQKIYQDLYGNGIKITHRDGIYSTRKLFFLNQTITQAWMDQLKYFKGANLQLLYNIGSRIGTGKFSVVYEGTQITTGKVYAVKHMETYKMDTEARNLIAHESSIMAIASHPLLVSYKQTIQTKSDLYIVTQLVKGKDLFEIVKEFNCLTQKEAATVTQQLFVGIRYLHSLGIVHRDLKPQNIMIPLNKSDTFIKQIKIIDFGFADYLSNLMQLTPQDVLAGTPHYIAPQLLRCESISYAVDVFSIGAILYFMLSGTLPFSGYNVTEVFQKTMEGEYSMTDKIWKRISEEAKDLIRQLLQNDPQERISIENAMKHKWLRNVQNLPANREKNNTNHGPKIF